MKRRRPDDQDPDDVHREMLEHLDQNPPPRRKPRPKPKPRPTPPAEMAAEPPPVPRLMLRKMRLEPALERLDAFVRLHHHRMTPKVVVVVGKGLRSGSEGPVIGPAVRAWCDRHGSLVRDFHVAPPSEGGDGAIVIHLRSN